MQLIRSNTHPSLCRAFIQWWLIILQVNQMPERLRVIEMPGIHNAKNR